jgi:hypothetical protein
MNYLYFEWMKLKSRRWIWALAGITILLLPIGIKIVTNLSYLDNQVSEGQFMEHAAFGFINFSCLYLFLPLWIIVFIGTEFGNGHVNQVAFNASFKDYFISKLIYCILISLAYCLLGVVTMVLVQITAPFEVTIASGFYGEFIFQSFFTFLSVALLAMAITFIARNLAIAFVSYFLLSFAEGIVFMLAQKIYNTEFFFLPFHITRSLYVKGGDGQVSNYYNFFQDFDNRVLLLPVFLLVMMWLIYLDFTKRELKPLSD